MQVEFEVHFLCFLVVEGYFEHDLGIVSVVFEQFFEFLSAGVADKDGRYVNFIAYISCLEYHIHCQP